MAENTPDRSSSHQSCAGAVAGEAGQPPFRWDIWMFCSHSLVCSGTAGEWGPLASCSSFSASVPCFCVSLLRSLKSLHCSGLAGLTDNLCWTKVWSVGSAQDILFPLYPTAAACSSLSPNFLLLKQVGPVVNCVMLNSHSGKATLVWAADAILHVCFALRLELYL